MEFLRAGGPVMYLLVATSIVGLTFIIERGFALRWSRVIPPSIEKGLEDFSAAKDLNSLRQICVLKPSALSRLLLIAADHLHWPISENADAIQTRARQEVV